MAARDLHIRLVENDDDWQSVVRIRTVVFIGEQACPPEEEWDDFDEPEARFSSCRHFLGRWNGVDVAVARWHETSFNGQPAAKLERFAILEEARGHGFGRAMIEHLMTDAQTHGFDTLMLHAQAYLKRLYASLGYAQVGEPFDEAGIPHIKMVWVSADHA